MSYSSRRHIIHIDLYGVEHRLEFHQRDYTGASEGMLADGDASVATFDQARIDTRSADGPRVLDASLDVHQLLQDNVDEQLLEDIFAADEDEFLLVWKKNGAVHWTGSLMNDLFEGREAPYPWTGVATAKDFSLLKGEDYLFSDDRKTVIEVIADLLGVLPYQLDIETATGWQHGSSTGNEDFLQRTWMDTVGLREYARTGDEQDERITHYEALEWICNNYLLYIKQEYGRWRVFQKSAYKDPENVWTTIYNPDGTQKTAGTNTNWLHDVGSDDFKILENGTQTRGVSAVRRARVKYEHRTLVTRIQFPDTLRLDNENLQETYSQFFNSDGSQSIQFSGLAKAEFDDSITEATVLFEIKALGRWWNSETREWQTDFYANRKEMTDTTLSGGKIGFQSHFNFDTADIPDIPGNDIEITIYIARDESTQTFSDFTDFTDLHFKIVNADVAAGESTSIDYQISQNQSRGLSSNIELPKIRYGEGPVAYSRSSLRYSINDSELIGSSWGHRGNEQFNKTFFENYLGDYLDGRRNHTKAISASTYGLTDSRRVESYRGRFFIYGGGVFDVRDGDWDTAELVEVRFEESSTDTFLVFPKYRNEEGAGGGGSAPGGGSGGGSSNPGWNDIFGKPSVNAGDGLKGGGSLEDDIELLLGDVDPITVDGPGGVSDDGHSHKLDLSGRSLAVRPAENGAVTVAGDEEKNLGDDIEWLLDVLDHGELQRGVLRPDHQNIYGDKEFADSVLIDEQIRSTNYAARLKGMQITRDGRADFREMFTDELYAKSFISDTTLSLASSTYLTKSMAVLAEDVRFPDDQYDVLRTEEGDPFLLMDGNQLELMDADTGEYKLVVEPHDTIGGLDTALVFEEGDYVRLRARQSDGGLRIQNLWGRVRYPVEGEPDSATQPGGYQWFIFDLEHPNDVGDPITLHAGSVVLDYGRPGDAIIESTALGDDGPYKRMFRWGIGANGAVDETAKPWDTTMYEILTSEGNLLSAGKGSSQDPEFGQFLRDALYVEFSNGTSKFGKNADGAGNDGIWFGESNYWLTNNSFRLGGANGISFDEEANKVALGSDTVVKGDLEAVSGTFKNLAILEGGELSGETWSITDDIWVHPSLGGGLITRESNAPFGTASTNAPNFESKWGISMIAFGSDNISQERIVKKVKYTHQFGMNSILFSGKARRDVNISAGGWITTPARIVGTISEVSNTGNHYDVPISSSFGHFSFAIPITPLTVGQQYTIEVRIEGNLTGASGNDQEDEAEMQIYLSEELDMTLLTEEA